MPAGTALAGDGFAVAGVPRTGGGSGFGAPEVASGHLLVTVRRGAFLRRTLPRSPVTSASPTTRT